MKRRALLACVAWVLTAVATYAATAPNITGQVLDEKGNGVTDAEVWLMPINGQDDDLFSTKTAADGSFQLTTNKRVESIRYAVVAWKPGFGVGYSVLQTSPSYSDRGAIPHATGLQITLPPRSEPFEIQVLDPAGNPLEGAAVGVFSVRPEEDKRNRGFWLQSQTGVPFLSRKTDSTGMVTFDFLAPETRVGFSMGTAEYGVQRAYVVSNQPQTARTLTLRPAARIRLQLMCHDEMSVANRELTYLSRIEATESDGQSSPRLVTGLGKANLIANEQGIVEGNVPIGSVSFSFVTRAGDTSFANVSKLQAIELKAGEQKEFEMELLPGVPVTGRVVDGDGNPVPNVEVQTRANTVKTDQDGRYEILANPHGWTSIKVVSVPDGHTMPFRSYGQSLQLPDPGAKLKREDIIIEHAVSLTGKVVDAAGKPVSGATVRAAWQATGPGGSSYTRKTTQTVSDSSGQFALKHVLQDVDVLISAETESTASRAKTIHTDEDKQVELQVEPGGMVELVGKLQGVDGNVIPNGEVRITQAMVVPSGHVYGNRTVYVHGNEKFPVSASGRFVCPVPLPRHGRYAIKVGAPGYLSKETGYVSAENGKLDFGVMKLIPSRRAQGVVVDASGTPVQDAKVSAYSAEKINDYNLRRTSVQTDSQGRFAMEGLHPLAALAIVECDGYRTTGAFLVNDQALSVTLSRTTEAIADADRIRPRTPNDRATQQAARSMVDALIEARRGSNYFHNEMCQMLLRIHPDDAVAELDRITSPNSRTSLLRALGEFEDALAESANISDPFRRCTTRVSIARATDDEALWRDALAIGLAECELIQRPDRRLYAVCAVADAFYEKQDHEKAEAIVRPQIAQANAMSGKDWEGYARGRLAEELVRFDVEAGLKMLEPFSDDDKHRHLQNIAHRLADIDPEKSEQVVRSMKPSNWVDTPAVRVAYRMAKVDLPRAMGLLDTIDDRIRPVERARALGAMAVAVAEKGDSAKAAELLKQGFDAIPAAGRSGGRGRDVFGAALTLLRHAEQVNPENVTDYFWQTAKRYGGPFGGAWSLDDRAEKDANQQAQLATLLALYSAPDAIVRQVVEPLFAHWEQELEKTNVMTRFSDYEASFMAMALADPDRAVAWTIAFDKKLDKDARRRIPQPWEVIGHTLTKNRQELGKYLTRRVYHRWVIDEFDF